MSDPGEFDDEPVDHAADHRPDVYREDGLWVFRASSLGNCEANLIRQALGQTPEPPPAKMLEAFAQGNTNEPIILGKLKAKGWKPLDRSVVEASTGATFDESGQLCTELKVGTKALIRCHPDEVMQCFKTTEESRLAGAEVGQRRVVEAKALAKSWTFDTYYREKCAWQTSVEVATTGLPLLFVVGWKDDETKIVEDIEYIIPEAPVFSKGQIIARVMGLVRKIEAIEAGEGKLPECDYAQWPCGFYQLHNTETGVHAKKEIADADEVLAKADAIKLRALMVNWRADKATEIAAGQRVEGHRRAIQEILERNTVTGAVQQSTSKIAYTPESTTRKFKRGAVDRMLADGLPVEAYREDSTKKAYITITDDTIKGK
jgi:hypothetical protein